MVCMDKIERLKVFCLVAENKSFSQVAKLLNLPRSTITYAIQTLEKEYEVLLFYRTTRSVSLTHVGQDFYEEAQNLIRNLKDLNRFKTMSKKSGGKISIGMPQRIATQILLPCLNEYYKNYPDIQISVNSQDHYSHLMNEQLDCVVRVGNVQDEYLISRNIGNVKIKTYASPNYIDHYGLPRDVSDLETHIAVEYRVGKIQSDLATLHFKKNNVKVPYLVVVENSEAYLQAGLAGLGIIQIPEYDAYLYLQNNHLVDIFQNIEPQEVPIQMLFLDRKYRPQYFQDFIVWLKDILKQKLLILENL